MALQEQNALWQLFSGKATGFEYGDVHYQWQEPAEYKEVQTFEPSASNKRLSKTICYCTG